MGAADQCTICQIEPISILWYRESWTIQLKYTFETKQKRITLSWCTLVGNKLIDNSDVVGPSPVETINIYVLAFGWSYHGGLAVGIFAWWTSTGPLFSFLPIWVKSLMITSRSTKSKETQSSIKLQWVKLKSPPIDKTVGSCCQHIQYFHMCLTLYVLNFSDGT